MGCQWVLNQPVDDPQQSLLWGGFLLLRGPQLLGLGLGWASTQAGCAREAELFPEVKRKGLSLSRWMSVFTLNGVLMRVSFGVTIQKLNFFSISFSPSQTLQQNHINFLFKSIIAHFLLPLAMTHAKYWTMLKKSLVRRQGK